MAKPNKTVEKAAMARQFDEAKQAQKDSARASRRDPFMQFVFDQAAAGVTFKTTEEAAAAFAAKP